MFQQMVEDIAAERLKKCDSAQQAYYLWQIEWNTAFWMELSLSLLINGYLVNTTCLPVFIHFAFIFLLQAVGTSVNMTLRRVMEDVVIGRIFNREIG